MIKIPKNYFELAEIILEEATKGESRKDIVIFNPNNGHLYVHCLTTGRFIHILCPTVIKATFHIWGESPADAKIKSDIINIHDETLSSKDIRDISRLRSHIESGCNIYLCDCNVENLFVFEILYRYAVGMYKSVYMEPYQCLGCRIFTEKL